MSSYSARFRFPAWLAALLAAFLANGCFSEDPKGTEVENELRTGALYYADGKPASGAKVTFFTVDHNPQPDLEKRSAADGPVLTVFTDARGRYSWDSLPRGEYNVLGSQGGFLSYQDSLVLTATTDSIPSDTLREGGQLSGVVALQVQHDPRTVTVQVLGTSAFANVDIAGRFTLSGLAEGRYSLRVVTTLPEYTPLSAAARVRSGSHDTLPDTLRLTYTGIPVVSNVRAEVDTLGGAVRLSWSPIAYRGFFEYLVFKDEEPVLQPSTTAVGATPETTFVFAAHPPAQSLSGYPNDTATKVLQFQVRARVASALGGGFHVVRVPVPPPGLYRTFLSLSVSDRPQIGDTVRLMAGYQNGRRAVTRLEWWGPGNVLLRSAGTDGPRGYDTLALPPFAQPGLRMFRFRAQDESGRWWEDSLAVDVEEQAPGILIRPASGAGLSVEVLDSILLVAEYSNVRRSGSRLEWSWGSGDSLLRSAPTSGRAGRDTLLFRAPDLPGAHLLRLRLRDSGGVYHGDTAVLVLADVVPGLILGSNRGNGLVTSPRDTLILTADFSRVVRPGSSLEWYLGASEVPLRSLSLSGRQGRDTLVHLTPDQPGPMVLRARIRDASAVRAASELTATVVEDRPVARLGRDTALHIGAALQLKGTGTDGLGSIRKWEWDFGGTGAFVEAQAETTFILPSKPSFSYPVVLKVTDDDGFQALDTQVIMLSPWVPKAPMKSTRLYASAAVVDGRIYVMGGESNKHFYPNVEVYDTLTGQWTERTPIPTPRSDLSAVAAGKRIFAVGGRTPSGMSAAVEVYDTETDTWSSLPPLPSERVRCGILVRGDSLIVYGGMSNGSAIWGMLLKPGASKWDLILSGPYVYAPVALGDRYYWMNSKRLDAYEPAAHISHTGRFDIPTPRVVGMSAAAAEGMYFAIGGMRLSHSYTDPPTKDVEAYDPARDRWILHWPLVQPRFGAVAVTAGRTLYLIGGSHKYGGLSFQATIPTVEAMTLE